MKYGGNITILDDEGNTVFERELSDDEIVEAILAGVSDEIEVVIDPVPEPPTKQPPAMPKLAKKGEPKPCCGSKQNRHKKDCPLDAFDDGETNSSKPKMVAEDFDGSGDPMTEEEFDEVKDMKDLGKPSMVIASKLAVRLIEVNRAFSAPDYDWYVEHR